MAFFIHGKSVKYHRIIIHYYHITFAYYFLQVNKAFCITSLYIFVWDSMPPMFYPVCNSLLCYINRIYSNIMKLNYISFIQSRFYIF